MQRVGITGHLFPATPIKPTTAYVITLRSIMQLVRQAPVESEQSSVRLHHGVITERHFRNRPARTALAFAVPRPPTETELIPSEGGEVGSRAFDRECTYRQAFV
jgi:hypothetical protein